MIKNQDPDDFDPARDPVTDRDRGSREPAYAARDKRPGQPRLAPQEVRLLVAYGSGLTLGAAARRVGIRPTTAKSYLERIKRKYRSVGRPTYTKLDLASRIREDGLNSGRPVNGHATRPAEHQRLRHDRGPEPDATGSD